MNFKEHYTLIKESVDSERFYYIIHIKLYEPALDRIKAKPGYTSMVKDEKQKVFFAAATALNNYPFDGRRGAFSEGRMEIQADTEEFKREDIPYIDMHVKGVKIDENVIKEVYKTLHTYRPSLVSTVTYENAITKDLKGTAKETWEDILD